MKTLLAAGLLHGDCMTITGQTIAEVLKDLPDVPRADQDVIRPIDKPMYAQGHLAILKGNLSPEGCVAKITGLTNPVMTGPARVFDDEQSALAAILAGKIKAPVMLVHGKDDHRCPYAHYKMMLDGLKEAGTPVTSLVKDAEGHGFYKEENRIELYEKMEAFLDEHIGAKSK